MKTIFDKPTREVLISRINSLNRNSNAQWGKMNISQMVRHCTLWDEMALGKTKLKQVFVGRLFGKMALKSMIKDEKPLQRNIGSLPELIIIEPSGDLEILKKQWITSLEEYAYLNDDHEFIHSFFGKLNKKQTGLLVYKHTSHHLRQFGV
ncbi:MAG: DUF1569 domain-containing protein [Balneolales bacterium]